MTHSGSLDPYQEIDVSELERLRRENLFLSEQLLNLQARQTASADVLRSISRSTFDIDSVLTDLTSSATRLCRATMGMIFLRDQEVYRAKATSGAGPEILEFLRVHPRRPGRESVVPRVALSGAVENIPDATADPEFVFPGALEVTKLRAHLGVPLLRDGRVEGVFVLGRPEPTPFSEAEVTLVQTFADQAVIAIENARLFNEVQAKTRELQASLEYLRAAQDRLVQTEKLASLGQLTAGIAHEIKNPLNFINNFADLSVELLDELNDTSEIVSTDAQRRNETSQIISTLKSNLEKVVQHGRRADSIIKTMLLHSRTGSGERRPIGVNALVDESLNLAYHGARAQEPGFNVTLSRDFDPAAGLANLYPQEVTRVILNLVANGFYALVERADGAEPDYKPTLSVATRNRGDRVEIRVSDNGTGIPESVRSKMFDPFYTTKPAGQGTGLGLSLSHDIVVKQHGGTIDVTTEVGRFTEFTIVLPRGGIEPAQLKSDS